MADGVWASPPLSREFPPPPSRFRMRQAPGAPSAASQKLRLQGLSAPVEVRRHPAARRMTLRVSRARRAVIVTLPMQCDLDAAGRFVSTHLEWVRERLRHLPGTGSVFDGAGVPLRGLS